MSVIEYVGARYIPVIADPIEWDSSTAYEYFTIVQYQGDTYVSKQIVPAGTAITNDDYWILFYNFNAQYESLRSRISSLESITAVDSVTYTNDNYDSTVVCTKIGNIVNITVNYVSTDDDITITTIDSRFRPSNSIQDSYTIMPGDETETTYYCNINSSGVVSTVIDGDVVGGDLNFCFSFYKE